MRTILKKISVGVFILLFMFLFKIANVNAACSVSVSAPSSSVVGKTFKVTTTVSSDVGGWNYILGYDTSAVKLVSGSLRVAGSIGDSRISTYTFQSLRSGIASFKIVNPDLASSSNDSSCSANTGTASVTMKSQAEIEAGYSKNNNLSSLSVEGTTLSPSFSSGVLEYSATLPVDTTKAKVLATTADSAASVTGSGEIDVVDGLNKIEITVTAQHGEKKTYVINLTVEELDPIIVKVSGKKYTIVRKKGQIEDIPVGFTESTIKIKNQDVNVYKSEITKLTLVALKDTEGTISLFIYDSKKDIFMAFNSAKGSETNLFIIDDTNVKVPDGFVKTTFKYKGKKINGYKIKGDKKNNFYLVYAQNLETGSKGFYLYDKKDNTFQIYFSDIIDIKNNDIKIREYIILGLAGFLLLILLIKILKKLFTSKESKIIKYQKKIDKLNCNNEDVEDYHYDISKVDERPTIKKVEDDEYVIPKKSRKQKNKELIEARKKLERTKPSFRRVTLEDDED